MVDIINLRTVRKHKAREAKDEKAAENRVRFGQLKSDKKLLHSRKDKTEKQLDAHKLSDE